MFVTLKVCNFVCPSTTLPNANPAGVTLTPGCGAVPVPVKATAEGEVGALLVIVIVPGKLPAVLGAKVALKVVLAPTAIVVGVANPLTL